MRRALLAHVEQRPPQLAGVAAREQKQHDASGVDRQLDEHRQALGQRALGALQPWHGSPRQRQRGDGAEGRRASRWPPSTTVGSPA